MLHITSNVTSRHRGSKQKLWAGYRASSLQRTSYLCMLLSCEPSSIFHHRVWYCALCLCMCALCVYLTLGHHPHLSYPCAKFCFCHAPHCRASLLKKLNTQSLPQSLSLFGVPVKRISLSFLSLFILFLTNHAMRNMLSYLKSGRRRNFTSVNNTASLPGVVQHWYRPINALGPIFLDSTHLSRYLQCNYNNNTVN